jgi:hypothetical protein
MKAFKKLSSFVLVACFSASGAPIDELGTCQTLKDIQKRLSCYDSVVPRLIAVEAALREQRISFQKEQAAVGEKLENERNRRASDEVLLALRRMESRTSSGISYRDYSLPLSELVLAVRQFNESPASKSNVEFGRLINSALAHYKFAGVVWGSVFDNPRNSDHNFIKGTNQVYRDLMGDYYPEIVKHSTNEFGIHLQGALLTIWRRAEAASDEAAKKISS